MKDNELAVLRKDGDIAITTVYSYEVVYVVKKGDKLILKSVKLEKD